MASIKPTKSPTPGPSTSKSKDTRATAMALYNWCRTSHSEDHIFSQQDLLEGGVIPNKNASVLIVAIQSLVNDRLFRTHELRVGGVGWKVVSHVSAEKYKDLSSDESLVYSVIESAARAGAWVKTIKNKLNLHQKNVDSSIKTLIQRGYIKSMSTVKYPNRKMYILAGLQPGEDATGGAWFTDGVLDQNLLQELAVALERKISQMSWLQVYDEDEELATAEASPGRKRKQPDSGFSTTSKGKEKVQRRQTSEPRDLTEDEDEAEQTSKPESRNPRQETSFVPHPPEYRRYPTAKHLTDFVNSHGFLNENITENNMLQLLDVMVYDDKIIRINPPLSTSTAHQTMYKARKTPTQIAHDDALLKRVQQNTIDTSLRLEAVRELEMQRLGEGGMSEIPCGKCPVFDMCEPDGPVNAGNCGYFDQWFRQLEENQQGEEEGLTW